MKCAWDKPITRLGVIFISSEAKISLFRIQICVENNIMQSGVPIRHELDLHTNLELFLIPDKRFDIQWLLSFLSVDDRWSLISTNAVHTFEALPKRKFFCCGRWSLATNIIEICRRVRVKIVVCPFVMITRVVNCNWGEFIVGFSIAHQTHHQSCVVVLVCLFKTFSRIFGLLNFLLCEA